jgi:thiol:disulfide interchange protein DsbD
MACFLSIGLGLAAPTLLFAIIPSLSNHLPRPGRWMDLLRQGLAFPMYGSVVWLIWVISQQSGPTGVLLALSGLLLLGAIAWLLSLRSNLARILAAAAGIGLAALMVSLAAAPLAPAGTAMARDEAAEAFSPDRLAALRAQGRPVFVNMTAAWCVTCLVNERVALDQPEVRAAFARHDIAYLLGDWTRQDPTITSFLRAQHRDGVPLYLFYPPGAPTPTELPQILTQTNLLRILDGS